MFNKAIMELYKLKEDNINSVAITQSIDLIIKNLSAGMAEAIDLITELSNKVKVSDTGTNNNLN